MILCEVLDEPDVDLAKAEQIAHAAESVGVDGEELAGQEGAAAVGEVVGLEPQRGVGLQAASGVEEVLANREAEVLAADYAALGIVEDIGMVIEAAEAADEAVGVVVAAAGV